MTKVPRAQSLNQISEAPSICLEKNDFYLTNTCNSEITSEVINASNVKNFYATCDITRSSSTMAKCSELLDNNFSSIKTGELNWQNYLN